MKTFNSETAPSESFDSLHSGIQRWIWKKGWTNLRRVQELAIPLVLAGDRDVVISAGTAAGKTEAVFFPLATRMLQQPGSGGGGFRVLVISPLKALINDQSERLNDLLGSVDIPVHKRHGDISQAARNKMLRCPDGVLLITPESLEALFINRGHQIPSLFGPLLAIVVDELHATIGNERGMQLQSLMHRLEVAIKRRVPRLGLSATLGDVAMAAEALRPGGKYPRDLVTSATDGIGIRLKLHGFSHGPETGGGEDVAKKLFDTLRGDSHLIFANARNRVEDYAARLRDLCARAMVPNEFWPHHGSLSKELREDAERALKDSGRPATAICTSTLEMGIDIGKVTSIAQLDCPPSVASLRQRLGRSGRRGAPSVLRLYVQEKALGEKTPLADRLRVHLFQAAAMITLMVRHWIEPPESQRPHLSTLVQQLLSLLAQWGEISVTDAFELLCRSGPFHIVDIPTFKRFLSDLGSKELIRQTHDRKLVLDLVGERLVNHYSFYAAFQAPQTFRLVHGGKTLGELPVDVTLVEKQALIFAGRRWLVQSIDLENRVIFLIPAQGGHAPIFGGVGATVHRVVHQEMRDLYLGSSIPPFLDSTAQILFKQGRDMFKQTDLLNHLMVEDDGDVLLFPWMGDKINKTLVVWFLLFDLSASQELAAVRMTRTTLDQMSDILERMQASGPPDVSTLVGMVKEKRTEKHHLYLSDGLLEWEWVHGEHFDPLGAWEFARNCSLNKNTPISSVE